MWIKVVIVVLFLALLASLGSGYYYLMKDQGSTHRTFHSLSVRLGLGAALIGCLLYGAYTGQLRSKAPWDIKRNVPAAQLQIEKKP